MTNATLVTALRQTASEMHKTAKSMGTVGLTSGSSLAVVSATICTFIIGTLKTLANELEKLDDKVSL